MTKYFLISGASSGIGRALAEDLAKQGHHIFAPAPTEEELQSLVEISESHHSVGYSFGGTHDSTERTILQQSDLMD